MKTRITVLVLILAACGAADKQKQSDSGIQSKSDTTTKGDVQFTGYVQKAFTITVNGQQFSDSEDFYTNFIPKLVKPAYPSVAANDVEVDGAYGLSEFGTNSGVYMSATGGDGHLYQGVTDDESKFAIQVQADALDETFKARVVVRVGLVIHQPSGGDDLHYCYLLSGEKNSIQVSDVSKPVIFDSFTTELTKYKCDQVSDSIAIPGLPSGTGSAVGTDAVVSTATQAAVATETATQTATSTHTATATSTSTSTSAYPPGPTLPYLEPTP